MWDLKIISTIIDKYEKDGEYDVIHVGIMADITDVFTCKKYPSLNEDASERFIEYWSFIRKKGNESNDIYSKNNCPKCGSPLGDNMGEVSKCEHCGTITNKGDYDWILAEITQMSDYLDEQTISTSNSVIKLYEKDEYKKIRKDWYKAHFLYLMATQIKGQYDYFNFVAGADKLENKNRPKIKSNKI